MLGSIVVIAGVVFGIGFIFGVQWAVLPFGILLGVLAAVIIFGRRVQKTVYAKADGQPGAAAWALENLRGKWKVTPTVAATTQLDAVHRVLGGPGVVLVAGSEEGQTPLKKVQGYLMKLPRNLKPAQVDALEAKLAALGSRGAAMPKGPMPAGAKMRNVQRAIRRR
jgi:hypothetical protein